jgi:hypothetical protein
MIFLKNYLIQMKVHNGMYANNSKKLVNKRFYFITVSLLMISKLKTLSFFIPKQIIRRHDVMSGGGTTDKANEHHAICNNINTNKFYEIFDRSLGNLNKRIKD